MYAQFGRGMLYGGQRMMDGGLGFGGFGILAVIGFFIVAAAIAALIIWAIARRSAGSHTAAHTSGSTLASAPTSADAALAIARERLARGEIDPEQYTAIASALNGQSQTPAVNG